MSSGESSAEKQKVVQQELASLRAQLDKKTTEVNELQSKFARSQKDLQKDLANANQLISQLKTEKSALGMVLILTTILANLY